jgi:hypothetical protein
MKRALSRTLGWLVVFAAMPAMEDAATFKLVDTQPLDHKAVAGILDFKGELDRRGPAGWRPDHESLSSE